MSAQNHGPLSAPAPRAALPAARRTVFVMGDHPVVNAGLAGLIKTAPDLTLCGVGRCIPSLLPQVKALSPQLVIMDLTPAAQGFLDLLRELKSQSPASNILVLCDKAEVLEASRAVSLGASGVILKHQDTETFLSAIRNALASSFDGPHQRRASRQKPGADSLEELTDREREVLLLIGQGKTPPQIAQELGLSIKTVATHRSKIKEKLGLESSTELIRRAMQLRRLDSSHPPGPRVESRGL